jgi:lysine 6-dehydrogenase
VTAGCHFCDLGGNTDVVFEQHKLDDAAKKAGVTIAPDCGLAPGMANILAAFGIQKLKRPRRAKIYVGGLPQNPKPPLGYSLFFNIEGLTNEYFGQSHILRNGNVTVVETFSELEELTFPEPVGKCEAFITYGGTSTCPWTFAGTLDEYFEKTVRYPGHYDKMKAIYDLGLLDLQPVQVDDMNVVPRKVFHAVAGPRLVSNDPKDVVVLRVVVEGDGEKLVMELMDFYDDRTGFTAMQRTTGFGAAIVGIMLAKGELPSGSVRLEEVVDPEKYIDEMRKRGFELKITHH